MCFVCLFVCLLFVGDQVSGGETPQGEDERQSGAVEKHVTTGAPISGKMMTIIHL